MNLALENNLWAPAGREAVFACINICDALLAKHKRLRNISKDHMDVVKIVSTVLPMRDSKNQANKLRRVISMKNLVDYENKVFTQKQANEIYFTADRFYKWGMSHL